LSKVIKKTEDFVPDNLLPECVDTPPVWGNFARQVEVYQQNSTEPTVQKAASSPSPDTKPEVQDQAGPEGLDSDFTAPQNIATPPVEKPAAINEAATEEIQEKELLPKIDIEAIAQENFNKGVQAGIERMESDFGSSLKTLQQVCEQLNTIRDTILKNSIGEMKELVLIIAQKIIRHSVISQNETILSTVEEAILQAVKSDEFKIAVNPDDYDTIKSKSSDFINTISGLENIIVGSDASVERGGCIIESSNCTVDATIASQLEIIAEKITSK